MWKDAASDLGIRVGAPYAVDLDGIVVDFDALICDFGSPSGTVVLEIGKANPQAKVAAGRVGSSTVSCPPRIFAIRSHAAHRPLMTGVGFARASLRRGSRRTVPGRNERVPRGMSGRGLPCWEVASTRRLADGAIGSAGPTRTGR